MIAGIDIGTSYSSICVMDTAGKIQPVDTATGTSMYGSKYSLPSAVFVEEDGKILVGQAAMNSRRKKPQNFRMEFKRDLGQDVPVFLGSASFLPEDFYTELFNHMQDRVKALYGTCITKAYITCPAAYGKKKKEKIIGAARAAGLFDTVLVDEPTAAALCYTQTGLLQNGQKFLLYDFGGGTFDVSVLQYKESGFSLLAEPMGISQCGGIDMDRLIFQDMLSKVSAKTLEELKCNELYWRRFECQLGEQAVKAKHHLSSSDVFNEDIPVGFDSVAYELTLEQFNGMIAPLTAQTIDTCREVLAFAGIGVKDLAGILMVGGTSRVRLVQELVRKFAGKVPVYCSVDLELAVAIGALYADTKTLAANMEKHKNTNIEKKKDINTEKHKDINFHMADLSLVEEEASRGNAEACYELGCRLAQGSSVPLDMEKAIPWFEKAASFGYGAAMTWLGEMYEGLYIRGNMEKAAKWYAKAAMANDPAGQYNLGLLYHIGAGVDKNEENARMWIERALEQWVKYAQNGDAEASAYLEQVYETGQGVGNDKNKAKEYRQIAIEAFTKRAESGELYSQYRLGKLYFDAPDDNSEAFYTGQARLWLEKAAAQNHALAQYFLGKTYPLSAPEYMTWLIKAGENGNYWAQYDLGQAYANGNTAFPKDLQQAASWYEKASKMGGSSAVGKWAKEAWMDLREPLASSMREDSGSQTASSVRAASGSQIAPSARPASDTQTASSARTGEKPSWEVWPKSLQKAPSQEKTNAQLVEEFIKQKPFITKGKGEFSEASLRKLKVSLGVPSTADILLACDNNTWRQNGKIGYILTEWGIYSKGVFLSAPKISWNDFITCKIETRLVSGNSVKVYLNGEAFCVHVGNLAQKMSEFWPELQAYLKKHKV